MTSNCCQIFTEGGAPVFNSRLKPVRNDLYQYIRKEEAAYGCAGIIPDTLASHVERVAAHAIRLAQSEGVDPLCAEIAGLFHDAGKFHDGKYHDDNRPEEERSIEVLLTLGEKNGLDRPVIDHVSDAIRRLYRDDLQPTPLSMVLFDADNLDKLGYPGIANYFIKYGLRGRGLTEDVVFRLTVELTYARHAPRCMFTKTARAIAERRASDTLGFIHGFLDSLREDGLFDTGIRRITVDGLELDVVTPSSCRCGAPMHEKQWTEKGVKCTEIHLERACNACDNRYKIRFCRPKLVV